MFGGLSVSAGRRRPARRSSRTSRGTRSTRSSTTPRSSAGCAGSSSAIKRILLNQAVVSGVGNIYADEALWLARVHGDRSGDRLRGTRCRARAGRGAEVMSAALGQGGTSFDALYVNVNGESGYFDRSLEVYGRRACPARGAAPPSAGSRS